MTRFIFIRHAQSDFQVRDDQTRPLTPSGLLAASQIPEVFKDLPIDHIYSSPYKRAVDTITPLARSKNLVIRMISDLRERATGGWVDNFSIFSKRQWDDFSFKHGDGESLEEVAKRQVQALSQILKEDCGDKTTTILIGTHGTALCTLLNHYDQTIGYDFFLSIKDKMPLFIEMVFDGAEYLSFRELFIESEVT